MQALEYELGTWHLTCQPFKRELLSLQKGIIRISSIFRIFGLSWKPRLQVNLTPEASYGPETRLELLARTSSIRFFVHFLISLGITRFANSSSSSKAVIPAAFHNQAAAATAFEHPVLGRTLNCPKRPWARPQTAQ